MACEIPAVTNRTVSKADTRPSKMIIDHQRSEQTKGFTLTNQTNLKSILMELIWLKVLRNS